MVTRAPFLKTRFGAYHHREIPEEDGELTHVGPGTPCGEYFRRFWQPICFSDELRDLPHRVKILGEELVAFRDQSGAVGLLELHCPHRGTSLEFGLIDAKGIRCCYHGWLLAADGTIQRLIIGPLKGCALRPSSQIGATCCRLGKTFSTIRAQTLSPTRRVAT